MALLSFCGYMWVGPVSGLEVAPESFQVDRREVGADTFSQPPFSLSGAGAARLRELINEMFSSNPPGTVSAVEGVVVE